MVNSMQRGLMHRAGQLGAVASVAVMMATLGLGFEVVFSSPAEAKAPGQRICYKGTCHRVKTISQTRSLVGKSRKLHASFYDSCKKDRFNPCGLTSSGERFRPYAADNAASPIYPDGTVLMVYNASTRRAAVVRVNNAGPYWGNRKLDLSRAAADKLGFRKRGVAKLDVRVLKAPTSSEARYRRNRSYKRVPGYIGKYKSANAAMGAARRKLGLRGGKGSKGSRIASKRVRGLLSHGRYIKPGQRHSQVAIIRKRLLPGSRAKDPKYYDKKLANAVSRFMIKRGHGAQRVIGQSIRNAFNSRYRTIAKKSKKRSGKRASLNLGDHLKGGIAPGRIPVRHDNADKIPMIARGGVLA